MTKPVKKHDLLTLAQLRREYLTELGACEGQVLKFATHHVPEPLWHRELIVQLKARLAEVETELANHLSSTKLTALRSPKVPATEGV